VAQIPETIDAADGALPGVPAVVQGPMEGYVVAEGRVDVFAVLFEAERAVG